MQWLRSVPPDYWLRGVARSVVLHINCYIRPMLLVVAHNGSEEGGLKVGSPGSDLGQLSGQYHEDINHGFYFCYS